jgi:hypothetical protein
MIARTIAAAAMDPVTGLNQATVSMVAHR